MPFKTITVLLLVSCLGAMGNSLGVSEEPPQEGRVITPLTITEVRWLFTTSPTTVQICTLEDLSAGQPALIYNDGINTVVNAEGELQENPMCANFSSESTFEYNESPSRYELVLKDTDNPPALLGRGFTSFPISVKTTPLTCDGSIITKITWSESDALTMGPDCLEGLDGPVCYHEGDITDTEFCFVHTFDDSSTVNVCLNGPLDYLSPTVGTVSVKYFDYGPAAVANDVDVDATLSLVMETAGLDHLRAIVRLAEDPASPGTPREATIHDCTGTDCTFLAYTRKLATYEVCVDAMDVNLLSLETATIAFTDLNLHVFDGGSQKSLLLESVFANGLGEMKYKATLYQKPPPDIFDGTAPLSTANLDCTSVMPTHACFGFLDTKEGTDIVYMALSSIDDTNTIIAPFPIPIFQA